MELRIFVPGKCDFSVYCVLYKYQLQTLMIDSETWSDLLGGLKTSQLESLSNVLIAITVIIIELLIIIIIIIMIIIIIITIIIMIISRLIFVDMPIL